MFGLDNFSLLVHLTCFMCSNIINFVEQRPLFYSDVAHQDIRHGTQRLLPSSQKSATGPCHKPFEFSSRPQPKISYSF